MKPGTKVIRIKNEDEHQSMNIGSVYTVVSFDDSFLELEETENGRGWFIYFFIEEDSILAKEFLKVLDETRG